MKKKQSNSTKATKAIEYLLTGVPIFTSEVTVKQALDKIRLDDSWESVNYTYIINDKKDLIGVVSMKELLLAKDKFVLSKVMRQHPVGVDASASQESVAVVAIHNKIKSVPVFRTGTRELLGIIGADRIFQILHQRHVEDMLRFSGITQQHPTVDILKISGFKLFKIRIPWLLIGLAGGILATALVGQFEETLRKEIALSFFIPVLVYVSNAIAIQSQILLIRRLASQKTKSTVFLKKELFVSVLLALTSALILCVYAFFWIGSLQVALTIGLAVLISTVIAVCIAISIPLILFTLKKDPALGSGPLATAIQDISTLLIYFLIATLIIF